MGCSLLEWFRSLTAGEFLTDRSLALSTPGSLKVFAHSCSHSTNIRQQQSEQICSTESSWLLFKEMSKQQGCPEGDLLKDHTGDPGA